MQSTIMIRAIYLISIFTVVIASAGRQMMGWPALGGAWGAAVLAIATLGALTLSCDKSTWLPFLGPSALPPTALAIKTPTDATFTATVNVPEKTTHVVYWASNKATTIFTNPQDAYSTYENTGVVVVSGTTAQLPLRCPGAYRVMGNKLLPKHVHYRFVFADGIMSDVKTKNVVCA